MPLVNGMLFAILEELLWRLASRDDFACTGRRRCTGGELGSKFLANRQKLPI
jgi:hypothetical protein